VETSAWQSTGPLSLTVQLFALRVCNGIVNLKVLEAELVSKYFGTDFQDEYRSDVAP
jgi:hypothetical protein